MFPNRSLESMLSELDGLQAEIGRAQRRVLSLMAEIQRSEACIDYGAQSAPHLMSIRYGTSGWKANRMLDAAEAIEQLPAVAQALETGELDLDKVLELCRLATPETERELLEWAGTVSVGMIRWKADLARRMELEEAEDVETTRSARWGYFDSGRRFYLSAQLPAASGAVIEGRLTSLLKEIPELPGEEGRWGIEQRRADAVVAACISGGKSDGVSEARDIVPTIVIHTTLEALASDSSCSEIGGDGIIHPETVRRLLCHAKVQISLEDQARNVLRLGRTTRVPSVAMMRALRYRDRGCRFGGCGRRAFLHAHHIKEWAKGGETDLDNLILLCHFHHKLVHEHGWGVKRDAVSGEVRWFLPDGTGYRAGPGSMPVAVGVSA